jgi:hypothetical protein
MKMPNQSAQQTYPPSFISCEAVRAEGVPMSASQRVSRGFHRFATTALIVSAAVLLAACNEADVYTLYRSSPTTGNISGEAERNHVATFDAAAGGDYNRKNCEIHGIYLPANRA